MSTPLCVFFPFSKTSAFGRAPGKFPFLRVVYFSSDSQNRVRSQPWVAFLAPLPAASLSPSHNPCLPAPQLLPHICTVFSCPFLHLRLLTRSLIPGLPLRLWCLLLGSQALLMQKSIMDHNSEKRGLKSSAYHLPIPADSLKQKGTIFYSKILLLIISRSHGVNEKINADKWGGQSISQSFPAHWPWSVLIGRWGQASILRRFFRDL